jgi:hypothetical protein
VCGLEPSLVFVLCEMRLLSGKSARIRFAGRFGAWKFDSNWIGRSVIGVWSIVRIPPDTLADGKVKKYPLEYGLCKVFSRAAHRALPRLASAYRFL